MGIEGNSKFNLGNNSKNAYSAFNINNSNNININNKMNLESSPSGGIFFDGTNNDINLSQQPENTLNTIQSGEMEVSNINDINLSSGNNNIKSGASGDISSSVISFDIQNNNNIITNNRNNFETTNNNIFIKKEKNKNPLYYLGLENFSFLNDKEKKKEEVIHKHLFSIFIQKRHFPQDDKNCLQANACLVRLAFHIRGIIFNNSKGIGFYSFESKRNEDECKYVYKYIFFLFIKPILSSNLLYSIFISSKSCFI